MSFLSDAITIGSEVGSIALDATEALGEYTPLVGTGINAAKAMYHATEAHDAEQAGDRDKADFYSGEAGYDWLKAIPMVGTGLGVGELLSGGVAVAQGHGFVEGMDGYKDTTLDLAAMLGIGPGASRWDGDPRALDRLGDHHRLRAEMEERERFERFAEEESRHAE